MDYEVLRTVNVRQGPAVKEKLLGQLQPGNLIRVEGDENNGYLPFFWVYGPALQLAWVWASNLTPYGRFQWQAWPTDYRTINQSFGARPDYYGQFGLPGHEGVDIKATAGSPIYAIDAGTVYRVHLQTQNGGHNYGNHVRLEHAGGFKSIYAHLESIQVSVGQVVQAGDILGKADSTGNSTGTHLHLSLKHSPGDPGWPYDIIDPTPYYESFLAG